MLQGVIQRYITATTHTHGVAVTPLDIAALLQENIMDNDTFQVHLDLEDTNKNYVPKYESMEDNDGYPELVIAHHLSWTAIGLITILCILSILGGVWLYRRRVKIRFFFADALMAKLKTQKEAKEVKYATNDPEAVVLTGLYSTKRDDIDVQPIV